MILHQFAARHWIAVAVILLIAVGAFLFSWT